MHDLQKSRLIKGDRTKNEGPTQKVFKRHQRGSSSYGIRQRIFMAEILNDLPKKNVIRDFQDASISIYLFIFIYLLFLQFKRVLSTYVIYKISSNVIIRIYNRYSLTSAASSFIEIKKTKKQNHRSTRSKVYTGIL